MAMVKSKDSQKVITVRAIAFDKAAAEGGSAAVEIVDAGKPADISEFVSLHASERERPELTSGKMAPSDQPSSSTRCSTRSPTSWAPLRASCPDGQDRCSAGVCRDQQGRGTPIFDVANARLLGDLFKIVSELTEKL